MREAQIFTSRVDYREFSVGIIFHFSCTHWPLFFNKFESEIAAVRSLRIQYSSAIDSDFGIQCKVEISFRLTFPECYNSLCIF